MKFKHIFTYGIFCVFFALGISVSIADDFSKIVLSSGANNSGNSASCVAPLPSGDLIIAGQYKSDEINFDEIVLKSISSAAKLVSQDRRKIYIAKMNSEKFIWAKTFGSKGEDDNPIIRIRTDKSGNIYVLGAASSPVVLDGITINKTTKDSYAFLAKMNEDGDFLWGKSIEAYNKAEESDLSVNENGEIVVITSVTQNVRKISQDKIIYNRPGSYSSAIITRFDTDGNALWIRGTVSEGAGSASVAKSVVIDKTGNVFLAGEFSGGKIHFGGTSLLFPPLSKITPIPPTFGCVFLAKYDAEGNCTMAANVGSNLQTSNPRPKAFTISLSEDEQDIYITGSFSKNLAIWDKNCETHLEKIENTAQTTFYLTKFDQNGTLKTIQTGETKNCYVELCGLKYMNSQFVLIGNFAGNMEIGDGKKYVSTTNRTVSRQNYFPFVIKYDINLKPISCDIPEANATTKISDFCIINNKIFAVGTFAAEVNTAKLSNISLEMPKLFSKSFIWGF